MFCIYWILHHHPSVCCWTLCHHSAFISTRAYIHKAFKVSQLNVHYFKYTKRRMEERNKERRKRRKKERKQERERERCCFNACLYTSDSLRCGALNFHELSFFHLPQENLLVEMLAAIFFLGLKKKKCFYFPFTFEGRSPWADRFFCCCFPPDSQHLKDVSGLRTIGQELSCHSCLSLCHFPPLSLVCSNLAVFYFHFLCAFSACIQMRGCIYRCL